MLAIGLLARIAGPRAGRPTGWCYLSTPLACAIRLPGYGCCALIRSHQGPSLCNQPTVRLLQKLVRRSLMLFGSCPVKSPVKSPVRRIGELDVGYRCGRAARALHKRKTQDLVVGRFSRCWCLRPLMPRTCTPLVPSERLATSRRWLRLSPLILPLSWCGFAVPLWPSAALRGLPEAERSRTSDPASTSILRSFYACLCIIWCVDSLVFSHKVHVFFALLPARGIPGHVLFHPKG